MHLLWSRETYQIRHFCFQKKKINFCVFDGISLSKLIKMVQKQTFYYVIVKSTTSYQNTTGIISFHIKQFFIFFSFGWRCTKKNIFLMFNFLYEIKSLKNKIAFSLFDVGGELFFIFLRIDILYCWLTNIFNK